MITVRYFAAAAEAAGVDTETFDLADQDPAPSDAATAGTGRAAVATAGTGRAAATTAGSLRRAMVAAHGPELDRVLSRCSLLAAGRRLPDDAAPVPDGVTVDVLPPFAGG